MRSEDAALRSDHARSRDVVVELEQRSRPRSTRRGCALQVEGLGPAEIARRLGIARTGTYQLPGLIRAGRRLQTSRLAGDGLFASGRPLNRQTRGLPRGSGLTLDSHARGPLRLDFVEKLRGDV
ncbi:hypothetical protein M446_0990 [Methylobacterium sp. 4-46]|nr:hypothetical protein M446_0990 [Methylobacterium sp. 4-46]